MLTTEDEAEFRRAHHRALQIRNSLLGADGDSPTTPLYATQMRFVWIERLTNAMRYNSGIRDLTERLVMLGYQNNDSVIIGEMQSVHRHMLDMHRDIMRTTQEEESGCCSALGCTIS